MNIQPRREVWAGRMKEGCSPPSSHISVGIPTWEGENQMPSHRARRTGNAQEASLLTNASRRAATNGGERATYCTYDTWFHAPTSILPHHHSATPGPCPHPPCPATSPPALPQTSGRQRFICTRAWAYGPTSGPAVLVANTSPPLPLYSARNARQRVYTHTLRYIVERVAARHNSCLDVGDLSPVRQSVKGGFGIWAVAGPRLWLFQCVVAAPYRAGHLARAAAHSRCDARRIRAITTL